MKSDNELIAEFMGGVNKVVGKEPAVGYGYKEGTVLWYGLFDDPGPVTYLEFDNDWMWLMPVVIKCHELGDAKEKEFDANTSDLDDPKGWRAWSYRRVGLSTNIDQVYKNVVSFIKWYNDSVLIEREKDMKT